MASKSVPPAIQAKFDELDALRIKAELLSDVARMAHAVADLFPQFEPKVSVTQWACREPFIAIMVYVKSFDELIPLFRDLASRGWHTDKDKPPEDYHEIERRTYALICSGENTSTINPATGERTHNEWYAYRLRVMAFPTKDGAICKRVQVGTKTEPVYEWKCEETAT